MSGCGHGVEGVARLGRAVPADLFCADRFTSGDLGQVVAGRRQAITCPNPPVRVPGPGSWSAAGPTPSQRTTTPAGCTTARRHAPPPTRSADPAPPTLVRRGPPTWSDADWGPGSATLCTRSVRRRPRRTDLVHKDDPRRRTARTGAAPSGAVELQLGARRTKWCGRVARSGQCVGRPQLRSTPGRGRRGVRDWMARTRPGHGGWSGSVARICVTHQADTALAGHAQTCAGDDPTVGLVSASGPHQQRSRQTDTDTDTDTDTARTAHPRKRHKSRNSLSQPTVLPAPPRRRPYPCRPHPAGPTLRGPTPPAPARRFRSPPGAVCRRGHVPSVPFGGLTSEMAGWRPGIRYAQPTTLGRQPTKCPRRPPTTWTNRRTTTATTHTSS